MINHFFLERVLSFLTPDYSTCFVSLAILCLLFLHYSLNVQILRVVLLAPFSFYILHHSLGYLTSLHGFKYISFINDLQPISPALNYHSLIQPLHLSIDVPQWPQLGILKTECTSFPARLLFPYLVNGISIVLLNSIESLISTMLLSLHSINYQILWVLHSQFLLGGSPETFNGHLITLTAWGVF